MRNRELRFADAHLGLSKDVFHNTATISHFSLEELGGKDALEQIREKLLSLADSAEEERSADAALRNLEKRIAAIGQPAARTRPLPAARTRLAELTAEYRRAKALRDEIEDVEERRRAIIEEVASLRARREELTDALAGIELADRAKRLEEAESLTAQIDGVTQRCFALGAAREFPVERIPEMQRVETLAQTARQQLQRTERERDALAAELKTEVARTGGASLPSMAEIPEDVEQRLAELEGSIQRLRDRLEETEAALSAARERLSKADEDLEALPDFSRASADPVAWLSQLSGSFELARRSRDDEQEKLATLSADVARRRQDIAGPHAIFAEHEDFLEEAREFALKTRMTEERLEQLGSQADVLRGDTREFGERAISFFWLTVVSLGAIAGFLLAGYYQEMPGLFVPATLTGLAFLYFLGNMIYLRGSARRAAARLANNEEEAAQLRSADEATRKTMQHLMDAGDCETVRELEALYDRFRESAAALASQEQAVEELQARVDDTKERVAQLFEHMRSSLATVGEDIEVEDDVGRACQHAIGRYQEYRDAKRRAGENRQLVLEHEEDLARIRTELDTRLKDEVATALDVRRSMRENGFPDESRYDSALSALRAYRIRSAQVRQKRGRVEVLQEKLQAIESQIAAEKNDLAEHEEALAKSLKSVGADSPEQGRALAQQAQQYRELWRERSALQNQLDTLLHGEDLATLRERVEGEGPAPTPGGQSADAIKRDIEAVSQRIESREKEEHALHIELTERTAGSRSLNEIEEERAALARRVDTLAWELDAASYAATVIEAVARDTHARVAPKLAKAASEFLSDITGGVYGELLISRELEITVRIPQTARLAERPELSLSKGTVDQVYFALRLAMVQALSESAERIPMLLDDPFANYDNARLERALRLLMQMSDKNQILLFTCRDDVRRAARAVGATVMELDRTRPH